MRLDRAVFGCLLIGALSAGAEVTNVTASLELLGNPTTTKWPSVCIARSVMDLQVYDGKVFIGTGDWENNAGPVPLLAYDPAKNAFTNEYSSGSDSIERYHVFNDGRLYASAIDPRETAANKGMLFRRELSGKWSYMPTHGEVKSSSGSTSLTTHVWDTERCGKYTFIAGYGIAMSTNDCDWALVDNFAPYSTRMTCFIRCGDEIFCRDNRSVNLSGTSASSGTVEQDIFGYGQCVMWRWVESTGVFETYTNTWANVAPGLKHSDTYLQNGTNNKTASAGASSWHATPFGNRSLYVLGEYGMSKKINNVSYVTQGVWPLMAVSAYATDDGKGGRTLKGDRINITSGYYPIDFCVSGGEAYLLAMSYNSAGQNVRHGVWKSTDGVNFTQILTFDYQQPMLSLEYLDGYFYFGVGHKSSQPNIGTLASGIQDTAGSIYRVFLPQHQESGNRPFVPFYLRELNVDTVRSMGITGKGVRVGIVDGPINEVTLTNGVKNLTIARRAGASGGNGHGVSVASIIASRTFGIAPDCELYAYDVGNASGSTQVNNSLKGIWWCATNGCKVINCSFSFNPYQPGVMELRENFDAELRRIREQTGVILINSLGNNETNDNPYFPQDTDCCICIGGVTQDLQPSAVTQGWRQDFCAFATRVPTFTTSTGSASYQTGTSFSAPMATGLVALLLQQNPDLTQDEVYGIFKEFAKPLAPGKTREYGWGLLQACVLPKDFKRQSAYDADRAAKKKLESITINNTNIFYNPEAACFDVTLRVGTAIHLDYTPNPADATDPRAYWYVGRTDLLLPIVEDEMLWVKDDPSLVGSFA